MTVAIEEMTREELVDALYAARSDIGGNDGFRSEQLVRDLQLHQIELEMQNRSLRESQAQLESSRNRYADLFDLAPFIFCTLDPTGRIEDVNHTGAAYFGADR